MKENIYKQHEENTDWTNRLSFYKDDTKIMTGRLEELVTKNNSKEVLAEVEHFQNQFIIQRNNIDEILHLVKVNDEKLRAEINSNPVAADHKRTEYHATEKDLVNSFEKNFNDLRREFNEFVAKWL